MQYHWVQGVVSERVHRVQVIGEEFAYGNTHSRGFRTILFLATMAGFTLVALLQLIHDGD